MKSVADRLREADRRALRGLTPAERVALVLRLGERDLELCRHGRQPPLDRSEARRRLARQRQVGRRRSASHDAAIG